MTILTTILSPEDNHRGSRTVNVPGVVAQGEELLAGVTLRIESSGSSSDTSPRVLPVAQAHDLMVFARRLERSPSSVYSIVPRTIPTKLIHFPRYAAVTTKFSKTWSAFCVCNRNDQELQKPCKPALSPSNPCITAPSFSPHPKEATMESLC